MTELDALIAEKVMGLSHKEMWGINDYREDGRPVYVPDFPCYSTSIEAAWEVVEKLKELHKEIAFSTVYHPGDCKWFWTVKVNEQNNQKEWAHGIEQTAPLAICIAALKAVGHEVKD